MINIYKFDQITSEIHTKNGKAVISTVKQLIIISYYNRIFIHLTSSYSR